MKMPAKTKARTANQQPEIVSDDQELQTQTTSNLPDLFGNAGAGAILNPEDIILPIVVLRQNSFKKPYMKAFNAGDAILRPNDELLASEGQPVDFVPISIEKLYRVSAINGGEVRTVRYESAVTPKEYEFEELGVTHRRDLCFVVHALFRNDLADQLEMFENLAKGKIVDPDDFVLPARIVFTRSSRNAGKVLNTHFEMCKAIGQSPATISFQLKTEEVSNDKGNWYTFDVQKIKTKEKYTPENLLPICNFWVKTMASNSFAAHEDEDAAEGVVDAVAVSNEERF